MAALTELYYTPSQTLQLAEWHVYGSSRFGIYKAYKALVKIIDETITTISYQTRVKFRYNGKKQYELSNHLGNVLVTISDRRKAICNNQDSTLSYSAVVLTATDYYSFGSPMVGRTYEGDTSLRYRFGFNGKEKTDEISGDGNAVDYGARILDTRAGRWFSVDPLQRKYASKSPYIFAGSSLITFYDADGNIILIYYTDIKGNKQSLEYKPGIEPNFDGLQISESEKQFVNQVHEAISYNTNSEKGKEVWDQLDKSSGVVTITHAEATSQDDQKANKFEGKGTEQIDGKRYIGNINFDPNSVILVLSDDGKEVLGDVAPSTALIHEAGHAQSYDNAQQNIGENLLEYNKRHDALSENPNYKFIEEERNITKVEQVYIREINKWEQEKHKENPQYQPVRTNSSMWIKYDKKDNVANPNKLLSPETYKNYRENYKTDNGKYPDDIQNQ